MRCKEVIFAYFSGSGTVASLFPTTHPSIIPSPYPQSQFHLDSFSMRACELCRRAELMLDLSPALGAQPDFTTDLRSARSRRCIEPTPGGNDEGKAKLRCYYLQGLPPTRNRGRSNCISVCELQYIQRDASISMGAFVRLFIFQNDPSDSDIDPDDGTLDFSTAYEPPTLSFCPFGLDACTTNRWQTPPCAGRVKGKT